MDEFIFEHAPTGKRSKIKANNSDIAMILCFQINGWLPGEILYLGRASTVENLSFLKYRDELHYIPGGRF